MARPDAAELQAFMQAIKGRESGGNYRAQSAPNSNGRGRATGAYQWLNGTWGGYKGYARAMDAPPEIQEERAAQQFTAYYQRYGSWDLVALAWFAGPGRADKAAKYGIDSVGQMRDLYGTTVTSYVDSIRTSMGNYIQQGLNESSIEAKAAAKSGVVKEPRRGGGYTGVPVSRDPIVTTAEDAAEQSAFVGRNFRGPSSNPLSSDQGGPGVVGSAFGGSGVAGETPLVPLENGGELDLSDTEAVQTEVEARYGNIPDEEFVDRLYRDVLSRDPDANGREYWLGQLEGGMSRGDVYRSFYGSEEAGGVEPPLLSDVEQMIRNSYPDWAWAMNNDEIREILLEAVDPARGLDSAAFLSKIRQTDWWANNSASVRYWDSRSAMDPATAEREVETKATELQRKATKLGAALNDAQLKSLAEKALRFNLTDAEINEALAAYMDAANPLGDVAANLRVARDMSRDYLIQMEDDELIQWSQDIATGMASQDDLQTRMETLAKAKFQGNEHLMTLIDSGMEPASYFSEHKSLIAREMDLDVDQVDLLSPQWGQVTTYGTEGGVRPMNLDETRSYIRSQSGWDQTSTGRRRVAETTRALLDAFGKVA